MLVNVCIVHAVLRWGRGGDVTLCRSVASGQNLHRQTSGAKRYFIFPVAGHSEICGRLAKTFFRQTTSTLSPTIIVLFQPAVNLPGEPRNIKDPKQK